ncbi:MAG: M20/M25/M40 family metallo-hydrolase [Planctomycetota bacterium]
MLTENEQRLCAEIASRESALLEDLKLHVGLPTGGHNTPALDESRERLSSRLEALGARTELVPGEEKPAWLSLGEKGGGRAIPPTAVCRRTEGRPGAKVMVAGHLDTVHDPEGDFRELSIRPDGKTATGPGCVDMKGGLVIAAAALEALDSVGIDCAWTFTLNSDEETGTYHSDACLRAEAPKHDWGLALEPALPGGELAIDRMGSGQFMVECRGKSAHVGRAFTEGVSAVTKLAECLVEISKMPEPERGKILNVGPLKGNDAPNAVPDLARAWGNVRFPDGAMSDEIAAQLDALSTGEAMPSAEVFRSFNRPAKPVNPEVEKLGLAARAVAEDLGQQLPFAKTGGVCDGNIMQDAGLTTIDTLGVRGGGLHTPDEWIELASVVERCQLLAVLIGRLCSGSD